MKDRSESFFQNLGSDMPASVVVFLVALPLCLGIALGSQAPLMSGIIAGIVGGVVIGLLSGSQLSVSGPAAGLTAIVVAALEKLPAFEAFLLAVVLAGIFQVILGFIRAGVIGDYIPSAVIKGMLAAIGLILILKQFPHMVGYDADYEGDESFIQPGDENTFTGLFESVSHLLPWAFLIGILSLLIQIFWEKRVAPSGRFFQLIPAPLVVVLVGVLLNQYALNSLPGYGLMSEHLVNLPAVGSFEEVSSFFTAPGLQYLSNLQVWITAVTIALVASLETLLCIEASDNLDPLKRVTPTDRELKAQGVGNIVSGVLGGLPVTSVIVRTSANINAGARTKSSTILHGLLLAVSVLMIPGILNLIPKSALAAILIYTGFKLAKPSLFREYFRRGMDQFVPFMVTIVAILLTDLLIGILIGCLVGLFFVTRSNFHSAVVMVNHDNSFLLRMRKDVSYLNKPLIKQKLEEVPADAYVIIDASRADYIDQDVIGVIQDFQKHAYLKNITVELKTGNHRSHGFNQ